MRFEWDSYQRVALGIRAAGRRLVGVVAVSPRLDVRPLCVAIADEIGELCARPIAVVEGRAGLTARRGAAGAEPVTQGTLGSWVHLVSGAPSSEFPFALLDLQSLHVNPAAADEVDGVIVVLPARTTREESLKSLVSQLPEGRLIGVVLVSGGAA